MSIKVRLTSNPPVVLKSLVPGDIFITVDRMCYMVVRPIEHLKITYHENSGDIPLPSPPIYCVSICDELGKDAGFIMIDLDGEQMVIRVRHYELDIVE